MSSQIKNLSDYNLDNMPSAKGMKIAIVVAEWNYEVTGALLNGAIDTLKKYGIWEKNILVKHVPGTFELTFAASAIYQREDVDAIIVLGCVIQGETKHFDYICSGVTQGITKLNNYGDVPVIFGVLTTDNQQQAIDRAGGKHGNKGDEAAYTAIKMVDMNNNLSDFDLEKED